MRLIRFLCFMVLCLAPSLAFAVLPPEEIWREDVLDERVGFGAAATGGAGSTLCTVTNLNDSGAGSLRACANLTTAQWIIFSVSGTINLTSNIQLQSNHGNKTIDGRGQDILISGYGLFLNNASNVIITNIRMNPFNSDGIRAVSGSGPLWIHHITCYGPGDECIDIGTVGGANSNPALDITISWNKFSLPDGAGGVILVSDPSTPQSAATEITLHHNWYEDTHVRHPLARWAAIHSFNNYFDGNGIGAQARHHTRLYSENDIFQCPCAPETNYPRVQCNGEPPESELAADNCKVIGAWLVSGNETYQEINPTTIFNPMSFYSYTAATANAALRTAITNGAGWQNVSAPTTSLVIKLLMNDGSNNVVADSSGNSLNGERCEGATCPGVGPAWGSNRLVFDGANDGVRVLHNVLLNIPGDITIGMKVNLNGSTNNGLFAKSGVTQGNWEYGFWLEGGLLCFSGDGLTPGTVCSTSTLTDTVNDHHVAISKSGTTATFYIDGVASGAPTMTGSITPTTSPAWFGNDQWFYLNGAMWDARIYNGALTAGEIQTWAAATAAQRCELVFR